MSTVPLPQDYNSVLYKSLAQADPEIDQIIKDETHRQFTGLELIASENLTSLAVLELTVLSSQTSTPRVCQVQDTTVVTNTLTD